MTNSGISYRKPNDYPKRLTLELHENGCKFSQSWLIGILARYCSLRTDCRYSETTKMPDVIGKYVSYVIFEKNKVGVLPRWASCPTLPQLLRSLCDKKNRHYDACNTSKPAQNGYHFTNDIFTCIFRIVKCYILTQLRFVSKNSLHEKSMVVKVLVCHRTGLTSLLKNKFIEKSNTGPKET